MVMAYLTSSIVGKASEAYKKCLSEVQAISSATLFLPVTRYEAVQAMSKDLLMTKPLIPYDISPLVLVSGWSDNGWLSGGHAVRMAMELCAPFRDIAMRGTH
jgi:hypothetical protein